MSGIFKSKSFEAEWSIYEKFMYWRSGCYRRRNDEK